MNDVLKQARQEPQRGPGKYSRGAFLRLSDEKIFEFFKMANFGVLYIFERCRGPLNVVGSWVTYPLAPSPQAWT